MHAVCLVNSSLLKRGLSVKFKAETVLSVYALHAYTCMDVYIPEPALLETPRGRRGEVAKGDVSVACFGRTDQLSSKPRDQFGCHPVGCLVVG